MKIYQILILTLLLFASRANCQSITVTAIDQGKHSGKPFASYTLTVSKNTIAAVSLIPIFWMDRNEGGKLQDLDSRYLMLGPGKYGVTVRLTQTSSLLPSSHSLLSISVETNDTVATISLQTIATIQGFSFNSSSNASGVFKARVEEKTRKGNVPIFQISAFPSPRVHTDAELSRMIKPGF